jgi:uncharacterized protein YrzB (UPF0473 family)
MENQNNIKTPMMELKERILSMIQNGGTEDDLFAVIAHIDNEFFEKEKKHLIDAGNSILEDPSSWGEKYYNKKYK